MLASSTFSPRSWPPPARPGRSCCRPFAYPMLARTTFGVAENSQHLYGRALDVRFATNLPAAVAVARAMRRGGIGWYPRSGFIHLDSGPVRNWDLDNEGLQDLLITHEPCARPELKGRDAGQRARDSDHRRWETDHCLAWPHFVAIAPAGCSCPRIGQGAGDGAVKYRFEGCVSPGVAKRRAGNPSAFAPKLPHICEREGSS